MIKESANVREKNSGLEQFTNLYSLSKTLRFELIPVEGTAETIQQNDILAEDKKLADSYQKIKPTLDAFHRAFIDRCLSDVKLENLDRYYDLYHVGDEEKRTKKYQDEFKSVKNALRKEVVSYFKKDKRYPKGLFGKELLKTHLPKWIEETGGDWYQDESFVNFTTYFSGYNENRENMYKDKEQSTSIAYRMIDENLPKFVYNIRLFNRLSDTDISGLFSVISEELAPFIFTSSLEEMFELSTFNKLMTQGHIDALNTIIGGYKEGEKVVKGLNGYINEYNQTHPKNRLPMMQMLYKQILSESNSASWLPDAFDSAAELFTGMNNFCDCGLRMNENPSLLEEMKRVLQEIKVCDAAGIYIRNDSSINTISNAIFGHYGVIRNALEVYYECQVFPEYRKRLINAKSAKSAEKIKKAKETYVNGTGYFPVREIQDALELYIDTAEFGSNPEIKNRYFKDCISVYLAEGAATYVSRIKEAYNNVSGMIKASYTSDYRLNEDDKDGLKHFLDAVLSLLHYCKPLYVKAEAGIKVDEVFYGQFNPLYEQLQTVTVIYDKVRNYATQKPYSEEKIKLNFGIKGNFLSGWVESKTDASDNGTQYGGYLFRKRNCIGEYDYYLGISSNSKLFRYFNSISKEGASGYERLNYYQPKEQSVYGSAYKGRHPYADDKVLLMSTILDFMKKTKDTEFYEGLLAYSQTDLATPSGCLSRIKEFSTELYENLLRDEKFKDANEEVMQALKATICSMGRLKGTEAVTERQYGVFTEMMNDISTLMSNNVYQYSAVSETELREALQDKKKPLYLFRITNKDLAYAERLEQGKDRKHRGRDNLHTMYFKALMSGEQNVYDIGSGTVFYRPASIARKVTHPAGIPINSKNPNLKDRKNIFEYDLIKDRRFTEDKFQFHLSIIQNYSASGIKSSDYNEKVCQYLRNNPNVNILGIDRGERNLLYISMIDRNGNIVRDENGQLIQYSLNNLTGEYTNASGEIVKFTTPYHTLLDKREKDNADNQRSWGTIGKIKELKAGYMSQVISHITRLMVKYNAIIVMEDLNSRFINSRRKVDKQVYQNFERALIEKLNYLVFKDIPAEESGGLYNALQLADRFTSFRDLQKQSGFIFYIPAWNTSRIDPVTGFVNLLKPKSDNLKQARDFFGKFESICFNSESDWFEFAFDYSNFLSGADYLKSRWTVCTHGDCRYIYDKKMNNNKGGYKKINVTKTIKELFNEYGIDYAEGDDLKEQIVSQNRTAFFSKLIECLKVTLAMRYSNGDGGRDFILSPVADENGHFFNSEEAAANRDDLPWDADANGAYNIARKGLLVLRNIDKSDSLKDWTTKISNREWLEFAQSFS